ncbi:hypothetical protein GCM10009654_52540 [Streptomyces hebeiensis]|uniref:Uncharacterized protein n=1 Tax=Streptomyces hebeiensis TaxID=229486 RepID=A0ABP4FKW6_9ACTN
MADRDEHTHNNAELAASVEAMTPPRLRYEGQTGLPPRRASPLPAPPPPPDAAPFPGCDVCGALVGQREVARLGRGPLTAEQCNREIAAHPHSGTGGYR